jgi:hypothetical protein
MDGSISRVRLETGSRELLYELAEILIVAVSTLSPKAML